MAGFRPVLAPSSSVPPAETSRFFKPRTGSPTSPARPGAQGLRQEYRQPPPAPALRPAAPPGLLPRRALGPEKLPRLTDLLRPQTHRRKTHIQAMLSLARRRLNVLWAPLRAGTTYNPAPVRAARWPPEQSSDPASRRRGFRTGTSPFQTFEALTVWTSRHRYQDRRSTVHQRLRDHEFAKDRRRR